MSELKSGDIYVRNSDRFGDYRDQLISWEEYNEQIKDYCKLVDLPHTPRRFINQLKKELIEISERVDQKYPDNEYLELTDKGPVIKKHEKEEKSEEVKRIDKLITEKLEEVSILDVLVEAEGWLNL